MSKQVPLVDLQLSPTDGNASDEALDAIAELLVENFLAREQAAPEA